MVDLVDVFTFFVEKAVSSQKVSVSSQKVSVSSQKVSVSSQKVSVSSQKVSVFFPKSFSFCSYITDNQLVII